MQEPAPPGGGMTAFVRRTYTLLLYAILGIVGAGFAGRYGLPREALLPVAIADILLWIACGWFGWRRPINLVMPLFVVVTGLMLGLLSTVFAPALFLQAGLLTVAAFVGLSAYVHTTKADFSYLRGFLAIAFWTILAGGLLTLFLPVKLLTLALSAFGVVTFGCWILYDTSQIVNRRDSTLSPGVAAFELLLDLVGLFRWILDLLDELR
jgi:FtsH-binding integral membrane protein